jgi:hypothetical protein
MAVGFIAAFLIYGNLLIQLETRERRPDDQRVTRY